MLLFSLHQVILYRALKCIASSLSRKKCIPFAKIKKAYINSLIKKNAKTCTKCSIEKTLDCFSNKTDAKDGLQPYCKECIYTIKKARKNKNTS
jgi:hypothetical protein